MKSFYLSLGLVCLSASFLSAQTNEQTVKLMGIINLPDFKCALLEIQTGRNSRIDHKALGEGQLTEGVEVSRIDSDTGTVEARWGGTATTLSFPDGDKERVINGGAEVEHPTIHLQKADLQLTLELLGELTQRNVLRPSALTPTRISLVAAPTSKAEAMKAMTNLLQRQGIATMLEGEKFVIIVPNALTNTMKRWSDEILSNVSKDVGSLTNAFLIPLGLTRFMGAPAEQVLEIYAKYIGRRFANKINVTPEMMMRGINFRNATELTQSEACYAIEMMLACNGIRIVRSEDGSFNAVPSIRSGAKP